MCIDAVFRPAEIQDSGYWISTGAFSYASHICEGGFRMSMSNACSVYRILISTCFSTVRPMRMTRNVLGSGALIAP